MTTQERIDKATAIFNTNPPHPLGPNEDRLEKVVVQLFMVVTNQQKEIRDLNEKYQQSIFKAIKK